MARITIDPVTRIEGHAKITIHLDRSGGVRETRLHLTTLRGFETFVQGRPAEELPRIVTRICGICPWLHHLASVKAVDRCFGVQPPPAAHLLRELCLHLAHVGDKILHFFFLAAPDLVLQHADPGDRNLAGLARQAPGLAEQVVRMRVLSQRMLERLGGRAIHPVAAVAGGFSRPLSEKERQELLLQAGQLLDFALQAMAHAKARVFRPRRDLAEDAGDIRTGFLGMVDDSGSLQLYEGDLRLMRPDGAITDFPAHHYHRYLAEHAEPWTHGKMVYARCWDEDFSMDPDSPGGIYRVNTLARINVAERIATPRAQAELEEFRSLYGRPAQSTLLFHHARLIELIHVCERSLELLGHDAITDPRVRTPARPGAGRGIGVVEAPRGTLIHDYSTDENGCITRANLIVGTTHNIAPMNMSIRRTASSLIRAGRYDRELLNRVEMAVRAYDP